MYTAPVSSPPQSPGFSSGIPIPQENGHVSVSPEDAGSVKFVAVAF